MRTYGGCRNNSGCRLENPGFRMQNVRYRVQEERRRMEDTEGRMEDTEGRMEDTGGRIEDSGWKLEPLQNKYRQMKMPSFTLMKDQALTKVIQMFPPKRFILIA